MLVGPRLAAWLAVLLAVWPLLPAQATAADNRPPDPPVITSPSPDQVSPEDVHMELGSAFHDPDGDAHQATDWEIRDEYDNVVWEAPASSTLTHAHLGDGVFRGPLAGARRLVSVTTYRFRVRYQDSRGAWSDWAQTYFTTSAQVLSPLRLVTGLLSRPAPAWRTEGEQPVSLPAGAHLRLDAGAATLLRIEDQGQGPAATPGASLAEPAPLRVVLAAPGDGPLSLPASRLTLVSAQPERLVIFLPATRLAAGATQTLWVTDTGATFHDLPDGAGPDREHLARDAAVPWLVPPGYRVEAINATFRLPTSLAFVAAPGADPAAPRFYVSELHGRISVVTNDGRRRVFADRLLNFTPPGHFPGRGEVGIIGVCLPPTGHDIYATAVYDDRRGSLHNKVIRLRSTDGLQATAVEDVLVMPSDPAGFSHQIQQCAFGPDGNLYVSIGDANKAATAQDDQSFNGKVLRLAPDGRALPDNPHFDPANPTAPISYQLTKGHRNAFGVAWRPADGQLYLAENGPDVDRLVRIVPGLNYGWDGKNKSMYTHALYNWPEPRWSPVGLAFADGAAAAGLAPDKHGHLFVASAGPVYAQARQGTGKAIQEFVLTADGAIGAEPTVFARYVGEGQASVADVKLQPDGLYFTDLYADDGGDGPTAPGARVWRIRHVGQAAFSASVTSGPAPLGVTFTDISTLRGTTAWRWDFGDGQTSTDARPTHTFSQPGRYAVSLTLTAADGTTSEALTLVSVGDPPGAVPDQPALPQPLAAAPAPPITFFPETGVVLGGGFKHFWEQHDGLTRFGRPLTNEFREVNPDDGQEYTVQYFERARFEYHPEHKGTPYETQLGLLGRQVAGRNPAAQPFQAVPDPGDGSWFPETGHTLRGALRDHWAASGGLLIYGLPISEPFTESPLPGATPRLMQYFERGRLELVPVPGPAGEEVRIAPLGTQLVAQGRG